VRRIATNEEYAILIVSFNTDSIEMQWFFFIDNRSNGIKLIKHGYQHAFLWIVKDFFGVC
jgi:hypothetical protein